ncbi:MAG: lytic transglycosylase domain-containing protein [Cypionkella sp.]
MASDRVKPAMNKSGFPWAALSVSLTFSILGLSGAMAVPDPVALCDRAAAHAADASGVPIDILLAISRVETGRRKDGALSPWPWTINADGKSFFYDSKAAAVAEAKAHLTDGTGTFDVGCFQLNIRWHGEAFSTLEDMFDPDHNAQYAARFLNTLYQETGTWAGAVAAYHSRTPDLAKTYLNQVKAVLDAGGSQRAPVIAAQAPMPRENNFPLLQAGAQGSFGSIVPFTGARGPLFGGNP